MPVPQQTGIDSTTHSRKWHRLVPDRFWRTPANGKGSDRMIDASRLALRREIDSWRMGGGLGVGSQKKLIFAVCASTRARASGAGQYFSNAGIPG